MGFEHDVLTAIAEKEGFQLKFEPNLWDKLFSGLSEGKFDIITSGITITEERLQSYDFAEPHFDSYTVLLANPNVDGIKKWSDLKGKSLILQPDTLHEAAAKANGALSQHGKTAFLLVKAVINKKTDIAVGDKGSMMFYAKRYPEAKLKIIELSDAAKEPLGFAVKKGNTELLAKLNEGLAQIRADGTYDKIYQKWFH